jgi:hypothetical protein
MHKRMKYEVGETRKTSASLERRSALSGASLSQIARLGFACPGVVPGNPGPSGSEPDGQHAIWVVASFSTGALIRKAISTEGPLERVCPVGLDLSMASSTQCKSFLAQRQCSWPMRKLASPLDPTRSAIIPLHGDEPDHPARKWTVLCGQWQDRLPPDSSALKGHASSPPGLRSTLRGDH